MIAYPGRLGLCQRLGEQDHPKKKKVYLKDGENKALLVKQCVCDLVFIIPLQAARRAMAAVVGFSIYHEHPGRPA